MQVLSLSSLDRISSEKEILEKKVQQALKQIKTDSLLKAYLQEAQSMSIERTSEALKALPKSLDKFCKAVSLEEPAEKKAFYQALALHKGMPGLLRLFGNTHLENSPARCVAYAKIYRNPQLSLQLRFLAAQLCFRTEKSSKRFNTLVRTYMKADALSDEQREAVFYIAGQISHPILRNELYQAITENPQLFSCEEILIAASSISSSPTRDQAFLKLATRTTSYTRPQLLMFALNITAYTQRDYALLNLLKIKPACIEEDLSVIDKMGQSTLRDEARVLLSQKLVPSQKSLDLLKGIQDLQKRNAAYYETILQALAKKQFSFFSLKFAHDIKANRKLKYLAYQALASTAYEVAKLKWLAVKSLAQHYVLQVAMLLVLGLLLGFIGKVCL